MGAGDLAAGCGSTGVTEIQMLALAAKSRVRVRWYGSDHVGKVVSVCHSKLGVEHSTMTVFWDEECSQSVLPISDLVDVLPCPSAPAVGSRVRVRWHGSFCIGKVVHDSDPSPSTMKVHWEAEYTKSVIPLADLYEVM